MPRKKNTYRARQKQEQQIITARLIEISLKVDDYIYNQKPISELEAEQYMKEVDSYKVLCRRDERSLQVIEKLRRLTKAIILEHQELRQETPGDNNDNSIGDDRDLSVSPVYSITEEDRTQLSQMAEERPTITDRDNDVEIIDISDDDDHHSEPYIKATESLNSKIKVVVEIHRGISNLSLENTRDVLDATSSDANCSQSILNNFEDIDKMQHNEVNIPLKEIINSESVKKIAETKLTNAIFTTGQIVPKQETSKIPSNKQDFVITPIETMKIMTNNITNKPITQPNAIAETVGQNLVPIKAMNTTYFNATNMPLQSNNNIFSHTNPATNNNTETQKQTWQDSHRTCTLTLKDSNGAQPTEIYKILHPIVTKKANVDIHIPLNTINKTHNVDTPTKTATKFITPQSNLKPDIIENNSTAIKKKRGPRKKKDTNPVDINPKNKRINSAPKRTKENNNFTKMNKNQNVPIYTKNVLDDLSWIENIRYVREINVDENDSKLVIEESFWDNYYLPGNWSDSEFV